MVGRRFRGPPTRAMSPLFGCCWSRAPRSMRRISMVGMPGWEATSRGHEGVLRLLLERDAEVDVKDFS